MRKILLLLFFPMWAHATSNLISSDTWVETGDYKMAREDHVPYIGGALCSSCTISRIWDGTTAKPFMAKGELLTFVAYVHASNAGAATGVIVKVSSFTGTGSANGSGFAAVAVSSSNVWDYSQRPYAVFFDSYTQMAGMNQTDQAWDPSEYDNQQLPPRWGRPCTLNGKNQCVPNGGTGFVDRPDHAKFYPDANVPIELVVISSLTVGAGWSQAFTLEIYVSTTLPAGTYTAHMDIYESGALIQSVPIQLLVYNVTLPATPSFTVLANAPLADPASRIDGNRNPASYFVDPYLTTMLREGAFLHRHRLSIIGDVPPHTQDYPSVEFQKFMDGSAFTETYGLAAATSSGYNQPQVDYWIGTYGSWQSANWSTTLTGGANGYCTNVSSWTKWCVTNGKRCKLYTSVDEAPSATLAGAVNQQATWSSTAPACAFSGHTLPYLQTGDLPVVASSAPAVTSVVSTAWLEGFSSNTWVTDETFYQASSSYTVGGYNSGLGTDSTFAQQEEGLGPREIPWGAYKTGQGFWFLWNITYWRDEGHTAQGSFNSSWNGNAQAENDVLHVAKDFGYDQFPATDTVRGHYNTASNFSDFANGDGNMLYPGTDQVYAGSNFGFNGVIGSWRLNRLMQGIDDYDLIKQAAAINPTQTAIIVNAQVQDVMYLRGGFDSSNSFYYGPRPWAESLGSWDAARELLMQIIAPASPVSAPGAGFSGRCTFSGKGKFFLK